MYEITMPKLSDSMEVGKIIRWLVKEGDAVRAGDVLAEVESDKAAMELECFADGTLAEIVHGDGSEVAVGETIGRIAEEGEGAPAEDEEEKETQAVKPEPIVGQLVPEEEEEKEKKAQVPAPAPVDEKPPAVRRAGEHAAISPYARKLAAETGVEYERLKGSGPGGRIVAADIEKAAAGGKAPERPPDEGGANIEPLARSVLERYGAAIESVVGTGPEGQITLDDAIKALTGRSPARVKPSPDEELPPLDLQPGEADVTEAPFRLKTLARIVTASKHVIPHFYVTRGVDVTALLKRKGDLKESLGVTLTHVIMFACVEALKKNPGVNRSYERGKIIAWKNVNLGLAVDTDDGLTVAVLPDAQTLSLKDMAARTKDLVEKARAGKLSAAERRHPTFTVTNLGMYDVEHFQPIVNPPSAITLAVASALPAPIIRGPSIAIAQVMRLTASCDHRIISGVDAARFLRDLADLLEDPDTLAG